MTFAKSFLCAGAAAGLLALCGCTELRLADGCYERTDRSDGGFACVYDDVTFLRIKMPESALTENGYLDWAGKYSISDEGIITLKMPHEDARNFKFYFELQQQGQDIVISDYNAGQRYMFSHESTIGKPGRFQPVK